MPVTEKHRAASEDECLIIFIIKQAQETIALKRDPFPNALSNGLRIFRGKRCEYAVQSGIDGCHIETQSPPAFDLLARDNIRSHQIDDASGKMGIIAGELQIRLGDPATGSQQRGRKDIHTFCFEKAVDKLRIDLRPLRSGPARTLRQEAGHAQRGIEKQQPLCVQGQGQH